MLSRSPGSAARAGLNGVIRAPSMAAACRLYFLVCVFNVNNCTEIQADNVCPVNPVISSRNDGSKTNVECTAHLKGSSSQKSVCYHANLG